MARQKFIVRNDIKPFDPNAMPLRIRCPKCRRIYVLYVEGPDTGLSTLLGQACKYCGRFIREKDDPKDLLVDRQEIMKNLGVKEAKPGEGDREIIL